MNLEQIITAAVQQKIHELVSSQIERRDNLDGRYNVTRIELIVANEIERIAKEETVKHSDAIRHAVIESLSKEPVQFEIKTYANAILPKAP